MELGPPRTVKEVQSLNGKNRSLKQIRLQSDGQMSAILPHSEKIVRVDGRVPEGIQGLKEIPFVPTTTQPIQARRRTLPLHSGFASSSQCGLSKRREGSQQPVTVEKLAFALVTVARKLKPYFQAHTIIFLTDQPLKRAMSSPEAVGRMALWAIELSDFNIQYRPRTAVKGQIVADFIIEYTQPEGKGAEGLGQWSIKPARKKVRCGYTSTRRG